MNVQSDWMINRDVLDSVISDLAGGWILELKSSWWLKLGPGLEII